MVLGLNGRVGGVVPGRVLLVARGAAVQGNSLVAQVWDVSDLHTACVTALPRSSHNARPCPACRLTPPAGAADSELRADSHHGEWAQRFCQNMLLCIVDL